MNPGVGGLPFFGIAFGMLCAGAAIIFTTPAYVKKLKANGGIPVAEWRLPQVVVGGLAFAGGLFWFGYGIIYLCPRSLKYRPQLTLSQLERLQRKCPLDRSNPLRHSHWFRTSVHLHAAFQLHHRYVPLFVSVTFSLPPPHMFGVASNTSHTALPLPLQPILSSDPPSRQHSPCLHTKCSRASASTGPLLCSVSLP